MNPVRFGLVGCGAIHSTHCDALQNIDGATLAGVFDTLSERSAATAERYGVPAARSVEALFDQVDAVIVCVPSGYHSRVGVAAAKAGKHVISEKPLETTLAKAQDLVEACRTAGVKLACISQHRFAAPIRRLREAAQGGDLGNLISGDAQIKWYRTQQYYDSGDWRGTWALDGGGCLINQGVHYIDMIQWIMGGVRAVQGQCRTLAHGIEVEDTANALIEYRNGAVGIIQGSTCCYPGLAERLEVHGTYGSVIIEGDRPKLWKVDPERAHLGKYGDGVMQQPTPSLHLMSAATPDSDESDATTQWGEQHRLQLEDFTRAIQGDRQPFLTGEMALEPLKVILAIYESSRRGGARVELAGATG